MQDAGRTIGEVVGSVQRVASFAENIRHTAEEQSGGIGQINEAVPHIDSATQHNAATAEQTAAACEALKQHAGVFGAGFSDRGPRGDGVSGACSAVLSGRQARGGIAR